MSLYLSNKSLLETQPAKCALVLANGSKYAELPIDPKVLPTGINSKYYVMRENTEATSG